MKNPIRRLLGSLALGLAALCGTAAQAGPYSNMYVFGDSLSDTGNVASTFPGGAFPAPYDPGRVSNGLIWIDHLAAGLGLNAGAVPSQLGGNNYAWAGARTAPRGVLSDPPSVLAQVVGIYGAPSRVSDPNALYVVVGGGNDMRDARTAFSGISAADILGRQTAAQTAINNLFLSLGALANSGAKHVLLANLPDLGFTPEAIFGGTAAASTDASNHFNALIAGLEVSAEAAFGLDIDVLDLRGIGLAVLADATNNNGGVYGITNASLPCFFPGAPSCAVSAFSDDLHPTARLHAIFGQEALRLVPEPASAVLVLVALGGLVAQRRRVALA
jgi:phospholipase/lecithinase/hemolysin